MRSVSVILVLSIAVLASLLLLIREQKPAAGKPDPVTLFCAASNRGVIEAIRADYERDTGRTVLIQYGPSQTLLSSIEMTHAGDLYLPADDSFLSLGEQKGLIAEQLSIGFMSPVLAVRKGNPKKIQSLEDAQGADVRLVQANPDAAAIGKVTRAALRKSGQWDALAAATRTFRTTVNDVANDLMVDAADVGVVYDAVLHEYPDLEAIRVPEFNALASRLAIGILPHSKQPSAALHFARYVTARDKGLNRYREYGFTAAEGDLWSEHPELSLFAGSMLRPAIEDAIQEFEQREGVRVNRVYNGCGILVAQMKAGQHPDAYFACDREFMNQVPDLFPEPVDVAENELVILVKKGNPHKIADLRDLTRDGLRVGIGHEKQCAMGWLTQNTLKEGGIHQGVMKNVTVQTPTGDMLVNQLRTGSLDAAVVYLSNATGAGDELDAVRILGIPCSVAVQPLAISRETPHPQLASRLFQALTNSVARETFEAEGFRWKAEQPNNPLATDGMKSQVQADSTNQAKSEKPVGQTQEIP
jgi:molybdate transport system substrate-binding protein